MNQLPRAAALLTALLALAPHAALAGPTEDAKGFFNIGAQAFDKGDFVAALQAFEAAYRITPRPGVLFSIAQAHRKQYFTGGKQIEHLRAAIAAYREYLRKVEQGGRRSDAAEALADLESIAAKIEPSGPVAPQVGPIPQAPPATRVMITTQVSEATISLDNGPPHEAPLVSDVQPGPHAVRVTAPGYIDEAREVRIKAGEVIPVDIVLKEKPARLSILAPGGAQVSIDGRFEATTPLSQPLDVPPGRHLVTVTHNGYRAYNSDVDLARDEARSIDVKLDTTVQRRVSYALMGIGAAGLVAGGVLAGVAVYHQKQAQSFDTNRQAGTLACTGTTDCQALFAQYTSEQQARDQFRLDAGVALGAALLIGATGVALFAFDQPTAGAVARRDDAQKPAAPPPKERTLDVSAAPILAPGAYGATLRVRF